MKDNQRLRKGKGRRERKKKQITNTHVDIMRQFTLGQHISCDRTRTRRSYICIYENKKKKKEGAHELASVWGSGCISFYLCLTSAWSYALFLLLLLRCFCSTLFQLLLLIRCALKCDRFLLCPSFLMIALAVGSFRPILCDRFIL